MQKTVRELIDDLSYYPMDATVVVSINGVGSYEIHDMTRFHGDNNLYLDIEKKSIFRQFGEKI